MPELLVRVCVLHLGGHHPQELLKVDRPIMVQVHLSSAVVKSAVAVESGVSLQDCPHLVYHLLQLLLIRILAQRLHHSAQLLRHTVYNDR